MCVVDTDTGGKRETSSRERGGGERVWSWHWVMTSNFLDLCLLDGVPELIVSVWYPHPQYQHHLGTLGNVDSWPHPRPTWLEVQKPTF